MKPVVESKDFIQRLRQWDEAALAEVYDTWAPAIYRYAYRLMGDPDSAQEIVAETFQRLLAALKNGSGPDENISAWLYRVAHNLAIDVYRKNSHHELVPLEETHLPQADTGESAYIQMEQAARVRKALWKLTGDQRKVILLRYLEELSSEETARILGKPVGAIKSLQHRALSALRKHMVEEDIEANEYI